MRATTNPITQEVIQQHLDFCGWTTGITMGIALLISKTTSGAAEIGDQVFVIAIDPDIMPEFDGMHEDRSPLGMKVLKEETLPPELDVMDLLTLKRLPERERPLRLGRTVVLRHALVMGEVQSARVIPLRAL